MDVLTGEAACLLDWNFNSLEYSQEQLCGLALKAFEVFNIPTAYRIPTATLHRFIKKVRRPNSWGARLPRPKEEAWTHHTPID